MRYHLVTFGLDTIIKIYCWTQDQLFFIRVWGSGVGGASARMALRTMSFTLNKLSRSFTSNLPVFRSQLVYAFPSPSFP